MDETPKIKLTGMSTIFLILVLAVILAMGFALSVTNHNQDAVNKALWNYSQLLNKREELKYDLQELKIEQIELRLRELETEK